MYPYSCVPLLCFQMRMRSTCWWTGSLSSMRNICWYDGRLSWSTRTYETAATGHKAESMPIGCFYFTIKAPCVTCRGICWQKLTIIFITLFSLVYNHMKLKCCSLQGEAAEPGREANRRGVRAEVSPQQARSGFVRSWKTWKSHGILKWSFPGLEKSWNKLKS